MESGRESDIHCVNFGVVQERLIRRVYMWNTVPLRISLGPRLISSSNGSNDDLWVRFGWNDDTERPETEGSAVRHYSDTSSYHELERTRF